MDEPWLDSLSEDWTSQPRSSSPPASPNKPLAVPTKTQLDSPQPRSRIPRFNFKGVNTTSVGPSARKQPQNPPSSKRILSERSNSDLNIPHRRKSSSPESKAGVISRGTPLLNAQDNQLESTPSSTASIAKHFDAKQPLDWRSVGQAEVSNITPEWKKLVMRNQNGLHSTQDLFSPMGLEGMFKRPLDGRNELGVSNVSAQDLGEMPSSPPPWTSQHAESRKPTKAFGETHIPSPLANITEENQEDRDGPTAENNLEVSRIPSGSAERVFDRVNSAKKLNPDGRDELRNHIEANADDNVVQIDKNVEFPTTAKIESDSRTVMNNIGPSSSSNDFSPVFISKHNTVDGQIDYAALDVSNSAIRYQIRARNLEQHEQRSGIFDDLVPDYDSEKQVSEVLETSALAPGSSSLHLPKMSSFVNVNRGGYSEDGSFRNRLLSSVDPSTVFPSDSLLPSDSVSQVQDCEAHEVRLAYAVPVLREPSAKSTGTENQLVGVENVSDIWQNIERHVGKEGSSPLRLFGEHDTFTNNQLLRRMSQLDLQKNQEPQPYEEPQLREVSTSTRQPSTALLHAGSIKATDSVVHETKDVDPQTELRGPTQITTPNLRPDTGNDCVSYSMLHNEAFESEPERIKRQAPTPNRPPTPKRQRCMSRPDPSQSSEYVSHVVNLQRSQLNSIIGRKRKDARSDSKSAIADPALVASRQILRPRNPTPGHGLREHLNPEYETSSPLSYPVPAALEIQESGTGGSNSRRIAKARSLASEAATFRMRARLLPQESRKPSVSTQDYVDEAMKIMDLIRSKQWQTSDKIQNIDDSLLESMQSLEDRPITPQTLSRPPSRQGIQSAWRPREAGPLHPRVVSHLKKYEETGDESFLVSSIVRSVNASEQALDRDGEDEESIMLHELEPKILVRSHSDSNLAQAEFDLAGHPVRTHTSTDSSGRTLKSNTSSRVRTLPVIGPEKFSHLVDAEKIGMFFDKAKQTWVRKKQSNEALHISGDITFADVEDDLLDHISDLSVNEVEEQTRMKDNGKTIQMETAHVPDFDPDTILCQSEAKQNFTGLELQESQILHQTEPSLGENVFSNKRDTMQNDDDDGVCMNSDIDPGQGLNNEEIQYMSTDAQNSRKEPGNRRQRSTVLFSSPPVSHTWTAAHRLRSGIHINTHRDCQSSNNGGVKMFRESDVPRQASEVEQAYQIGPSPTRLDSSLMQTHQHQEVSLIEARPDGRTLSLSFSIATPFSSHKTKHALLTEAFQSSSFMPCLSPLSSFSTHQDDSQHLQARKMGVTNSQLIPHRRLDYSAFVTPASTLIARITDAEPEELYWDWMASLDLKDRGLDTLNMLEEFCPRLQELDISRNKLAHLAGAPPTIRSLSASCNALTNLTHWANFQNLQFLDVSHNGIENLNGFASLVHLRELKADHNDIIDIEGILDLDGLTSLNIESNKLTCIDFKGSNLRRLTHINISNNQIESFAGLESLPDLRSLNLSKNRLSSFSVTEQHGVRHVNLNDNCISSLDVDLLPALRLLCADSNTLNSVQGICQHKKLVTIYLRYQKTRGTTTFSIDDFQNVRNLYLTGTALPKMLPMRKGALELRTLDLSSTGIHILPHGFGLLAPNLRNLKLNGNCIKDPRPLHGIIKLQHLHMSGNRISRLRKLIKVLSHTGSALETLDFRDNPICQGFYSQWTPQTAGNENRLIPCGTLQSIQQNKCFSDLDDESTLLGDVIMSTADVKVDLKHHERLDNETRLRRRVYEILLASNCPQISILDGLPFDRTRLQSRDGTWDMLLKLGVVQTATVV